MSLKEKIKQDLNGAIKRREELVSSVLRMLLAAILNKEKEKRYKLKEEKDAYLTDEEATEVIASEVKKRKEAISEYQKGKRQDLADKEGKEAAILRKYLPEQLAEEEIRKLVKEAIAKTGAKDAKDMGGVMSDLMSQIKGRAEGGTVSKIVKELLS
jgi:uncharacterized protein YqeY